MTASVTSAVTNHLLAVPAPFTSCYYPTYFLLLFHLFLVTSAFTSCYEHLYFLLRPPSLPVATPLTSCHDPTYFLLLPYLLPVSSPLLSVWLMALVRLLWVHLICALSQWVLEQKRIGWSL